MKICFVSDHYPTLPPFGGIAVYTQTAARALAARGHEVHILLGKRGESFDSTDGPIQVHVRPVRWIPVLGRWLWGLGESSCLAWALWRLHRRHHFDIVEFPNWGAVGLVSALLRFVPVVVRLHVSTAHSLETAARQPRPGERFLMWAEKTAARCASATVTHSQPHRESIARMYRLPHIHYIPHGIALPSRNGSEPARPATVLTVGPLNARKGVDTLLAAIPQVLREVPEAEFWIVGRDAEGRHEQEFRRAHPDLSPERVKFLGFVMPEDLDRLYEACSVYVSASVYESFGLSFVEAMARGKAVVGCAASAMLEVIEHERTGLLVPPNDPAAFAAATVRLLRDRDLRRRLGATAERTARERFSSERMGADIERFFFEVIRGR